LGTHDAAACDARINDNHPSLFMPLSSPLVVRTQAGWTPLLKAVLLSNHDIVELLLESGADPNLAVDGSFNAMQCALIYSDERMIFTLIKHGAYVEPGENRYDEFATHMETVLRLGLLKEEDIPTRSFDKKLTAADAQTGAPTQKQGDEDNSEFE
jgi:ankyrin repeat protein